MSDDVGVLSPAVFLREAETEGEASWVGIVIVVRYRRDTSGIREAGDDSRGWSVQMVS